MTTTITPVHDTFTIERIYDASASEIWRCWTDPELRHQWFKGPEGFKTVERSIDFRVGGREIFRGELPNGVATFFSSTFHVIVPEQVIISAYDMHAGGKQLSTSLATMDLAPDGKKTRLRYTEQGVYLSGNANEAASRKGGTTWHVDNFGELLARRRAS